MQFFYAPAAEPNSEFINLPQEEAHHAAHVLRLKVGDAIHILNGRGCYFKGEIYSLNKNECVVKVLEEKFSPKPTPEIHIALALLKKRDRIEWFIEKAVELGANAITIFTSHHTEKKGLQQERILKIATTALKQSGNKWLPEIAELTSFEKLIHQDFECEKYIAYCPVESISHLKKQYTIGKDALVLIGPEGDFTDKEVSLAKEKGLKEISLGSQRLRAETAALYALNVLRVMNE
ncbi:MAG: RsmE family RNA methyltransferase [Bacteroidetes bacterium]|nr:RsmE family RNA methyltransferase [Bacteroidota bacterium]